MREIPDSSVKHEAEQFLGWARKSGGSFETWARSKDLGQADRKAILSEVKRLTSSA